MRWLWPAITAGKPTIEAPVTSNPGARRCTKYHGDGIENSRCGSLARIGLPVADRSPEITHAFDPGCGSAPVRGGEKNSTLARSPRPLMLDLTSPARHHVDRERHIY